MKTKVGIQAVRVYNTMELNVNITRTELKPHFDSSL